MQHLKFAGDELLAQTPWQPKPFGEMMDESAWVESWSGGWQLLVPNAGAAAYQVVPNQGFHGNASISPWRATVVSEQSCNLELFMDGWQVERQVTVDPDCIRVETHLRNVSEEPQPCIATEHLILGMSALDEPGTLLSDANSKVVPLEYDGSPADAAAHTWLDSDIAQVEPGLPARLFCLSRIGPDGIRYETASTRIQIQWDTDILPFAWLWQELGATADSPWDNKVQAMGIEPSNTDHGLGLDYEIATGRAKYIAPGESWRWWISIKIEK